MECKYYFLFVLGICLQATNNGYSQEKPTYHLPEVYQFDHEVVQLTVANNSGHADTVHYYYAGNGEYAAMLVGGAKRGKTQSFLVFTKDGDWIMFDEDKKTITIINMRNMMKDLATLGKSMTRDSLGTRPKDKTVPGNVQSIKTGNSKMISGYKAEEYKITKKDGSIIQVWYAKVDFNTQLYYMLGMGGMGGMGTNPSRVNPGDQNSFLQTMAQPNTLLAEIDSDPSAHDGKTMAMYTQSISSTKTSKATGGYQVNNYSNMGMKDMIQAQGKKEAGQPH